MKPLKKAAQKSVSIFRDVYTDEQYYALKDVFGVFDIKDVYENAASELRVSLDEVKDLKVVLDGYGYYTNVAVMKNGETVFVTL